MMGLQNQVTCSLCNKQYTDNNLPRILTMCGHTYCELCISGMIIKNISEQQADNGHPFLIECPDDNQQMKLTVKELNSFPKNHSLIKLIQSKKVSNSFKDQSFDISKIVKKQENQEDDDTNELITAINQCKANQNSDDLSGSSKEITSSKQIIQKSAIGPQEKIAEQKDMPKQIQQEQICLFHQKPLQIVCIIDNKKICSKCAIFGEHKGHEFKTIEEVQKDKNQYYLSILEVFKQKQEIQQRIGNQQTQSALTEILDKKRDLLEKEVRQQFRKLREQVTKQQKVVLKKLQETYKSTQKKINALLKIDQKIGQQYSTWQAKSFDLIKILQSPQLQPKVKILYSKEQKNKNTLCEGNSILEKIKQQQKNLVGKVQQILLNLECKRSKKIFEFIPEIAQIIQKPQNIAPAKISNKDLPEQISIPSVLNKPTNVCEQKKVNPFDRSFIQQFQEKENNDLNDLNGSPLLEQSLLQIDDQEKKTIYPQTTFTSYKSIPCKDIQFRHPLQPNENIVNKKYQNDSVSCSFMHLQLQSGKKEPPKTAFKNYKDDTHEFLQNSRVSSILTSRTSLMSKKQNGERPNKKKMKTIKISQKYQKMLDGIYNNTVDTIDFTNAQVGDQTMLQICEFIKHSKARTIKLIRNKLTDSGIQKMIPSLSNAQILNLSQNNLTESVIDIFIKHRFGYLSGLKNLILSQNKIIERKHKVKIDQLRAMNIVVSV